MTPQLSVNRQEEVESGDLVKINKEDGGRIHENRCEVWDMSEKTRYIKTFHEADQMHLQLH